MLRDDARNGRGLACELRRSPFVSGEPHFVEALTERGLYRKIKVYSQVAYEIIKKKSADAKQGIFSKRNHIPPLILRTLYMALCGVFAAMLPFFGDITSVVGAVGFIPLDFILPMLLYSKTHKPPRSSFTCLINISIIVVFTGVGIMGAFSVGIKIGNAAEGTDL